MKEYLFKTFKTSLLIAISMIMLVKVSYSQGPYSYDTPENYWWIRTSLFGTDPKYNQIIFSRYSIPPQQYDGIAVDVKKLRMDLTKSVRLLQFKFNEDIIMEVYYENYSLRLRRYLVPALYKNYTVTGPSYYDYVLQDSLFRYANDGNGLSTWNFRFYITSFFCWVQTTCLTQNMNGNFLSPVYFGLDVTGVDFKPMSLILRRDNRMSLGIGDLNAYNGFWLGQPLEPDYGIYIYAFKYSDLQADIQSKFSGGATSEYDSGDH